MRGEGVPDSGLLGGQPEGAGQAELHLGDGQGQRGGAILDQRGDTFGSAEIGLLDDAGLALDAGGFDDVVVEFASFLFGDDGRHRRAILTTVNSTYQAHNKGISEIIFYIRR